MTDPLRRIHALLDRLVRRERRLLSAEALLQAGAAAMLAWLAVVGAVNGGWARPEVGWLWLAAIGIAGLVGLVPPLLRWAAARDRRMQALRVEGDRPELRGELLTVLDRTARPVGSPALLSRLTAEVAPRVEATDPRRVLPATRLRRPALATLGAALVLLLSALVLPTGPVEALERLAVSTLTASPVPTRKSDGPRALVGDITLRYLFPTYTGLEPLDVPNASGDVHAPPGTRVEVSARTAVAYPAAALEVYDADPVAVAIADGRSLAAVFTVAGPGVWRFRFGELPSPDYTITPDPDLAPDISVQVATRTLRAVLDEPIPLRWDARDDYGLRRVVVEIKEGGRIREVDLRVPTDAPRLLSESVRVSPRDLGLAAGAKATLRIKAWDNDEISGSKAGWSAAIDLEVLTTAGNAGRNAAARKALRDAYVRVLAAFLVEPAPAVSSRGTATAWSSMAHARYEEADAIVDASFPGEGEGAERSAIREVNARRQALLSFARGLATGAGGLSERDLDEVRTLQADHVTAVEGAVLVLDAIVRMAAQARLADLTRDVADEAAELQADLAGLSKEEATARLDQLQRLLEQVMAAAAELGEGELKEFLNQRGGELTDLMSEVRKALAEGRTEDAKALMERLAQQLEELADGIKDQQERRGEASDAQAKAMEKLKQELESLANDQKTLREQTEAGREKYGADMDAAVKAWQEIERRAGAVATGLEDLDAVAAGTDLPGNLRFDLADRASDAGGLLDSARARNLDTALDRSQRLQDGLLMLDFGLTAAQKRTRDPAVRNLALLLQRQAAAQRDEVTKIQALLERMKQGDQATSPALQQELERLASQQQEIEARAERAADAAGKMAPTLPMKAPGLERGAQQGAEQAGRAAEAMEAGDAMGAEGGQQAAEDGFREAYQALEQAEQDMRDMQESAAGRQDGTSDEDGGGRGGDNDANSQPMALPAPEEFQTPEAYRQALLEGMSGAVPEEYKALNRRYYEELVRQ